MQRCAHALPYLIVDLRHLKARNTHLRIYRIHMKLSFRRSLERAKIGDEISHVLVS